MQGMVSLREKMNKTMQEKYDVDKKEMLLTKNADNSSGIEERYATKEECGHLVWEKSLNVCAVDGINFRLFCQSRYKRNSIGSLL
jgi:hypothetical protein